MNCEFDKGALQYEKVRLTVNFDINESIDCLSYLEIKPIEPDVKSVFIGQVIQEFDLPVFLANTTQAIDSECGYL